MTTKNPWLGLASYEEPKNDGEDYLFCGRDGETLDVVRLVENNLFVTLYGSSGIGKTSLLRAGVMPILRRKGYFPLYVRLSQESGEISYAEAIVRKLQNSCLKEKTEAETKHSDGNDRLYLWNYFAVTRFFKDDCEVYPVIILDQFEEVFREGDKTKAELLLRQIYFLLNDELEIPDEKGYSVDTNYRFVASIREDFLFVLEDSIDENSLDLYKNNRYRLRPMRPEQARQVVLVPGKECIEEIEKEKVSERVIELSKSNNKATIDTLLLSLVCASTFDKKPIAKLSWQDFEFWGDNPMRVYYQEAIKQLKTEQVRYIQNNLINKDGSRKQVQKEALKLNLGNDVFYSLINGVNRILTLTTDGQLELLHDQIALTIFEDRDAYEERERNWKFMEMQSRFVAEKAKSIAEEDSYLARILAIKVLPKDLNHPDRPYTVEAEDLLRESDNHNTAILRRHLSNLNSAAFSSDGKRIVLASDDNTIKIWNAESGAELMVLVGHISSVYSAAFSPDGKRIVSASSDNTVRIWDTEFGTELKVLQGHSDYVYSVTFSPDGKRIASGSEDHTVRIWDAESGAELKVLEGHTSSVSSVAFSTNGKYIVSASWDSTIRIWDTESGVNLMILEGHTSYVSSTAFSPDGKRIVSSGDRTVRVWDAESGSVLKVLEGHTSSVSSAAFSPDGKRIVSASEDHTVRIWVTESGAELKVLEGHTSSVSLATFSPDGMRIVSISEDRTVRIWDAVSDAELKILNGHTSSVCSAAFSPDGKRIVSSDYGTIRVWDAKSGVELGVLKGQYSASFSPDGKRIVSASWDKTVRILDTESGAELMVLKGHIKKRYSAYAYSVAFNPDGKRIVLICSDNTIRIWDSESGAELKVLKGHIDNARSIFPVYSIAFSPDGKRIVLASKGYDFGKKYTTFRILDIKSGVELKILEGQYSGAFSPDGKRIVSASEDYAVRIWDAESGAELMVLKGHTSVVNSASFSPDGKCIVSASSDSTIRIWDAESGAELKVLEGHSGNVNSAVFSPDGKRIVSASDDHTVRIWRFPLLQDLIDETRERFKDRPLTDEERRLYYLE